MEDLTLLLRNESVLEEKNFATLVLKPDLVTQPTQQLGSLAHGEVYIPTPYPSLSRGNRKLRQGLLAGHAGDCWSVYVG